jgi:hypothetical protein
MHITRQLAVSPRYAAVYLPTPPTPSPAPLPAMPELEPLRPGGGWVEVGGWIGLGTVTSGGVRLVERASGWVLINAVSMHAAA